MYAQAGVMLPFMQEGFPQEGSAVTQNNLLFPAEDDLIYARLPTAAVVDMDNITQMSSIYEYDLGEHFLGEPMHALDPVASAIAMYMMSDDGSIISGETIEAASNISPVPDEDDLLNEVLFYECKRELMAVSAISEPAPPEPEESQHDVTAEEPLQKCVSSSACTSSAEPGHGDCSVRPSFHEVDPENAYGMGSWSYSEGDTKMTLGGNRCSAAVCDTNATPSFKFKLSSAFGDIKIEERMEERKQKIFRYQKKRTKRNFGRNIKYACRKALADSQPRIRGRFARK